MKSLILLSLLSLLSLSQSLPHFTYDGLESFHDCSGESEKISFTIYGTLSEELNPRKMFIREYIIEDMGEFQCSLNLNEDQDNERRTHKITCTINGSFERRAYILEEPKVYGFDFLNEQGVSTWPKQAELKTFLIPECGKKIELDNEPIFFGNVGSYYNPINDVRKSVVDDALASLPARSRTSKANMLTAMQRVKTSFSLSPIECAYLVYKWEYQNFQYDCYNFNRDLNKIDYTEEGTYSKGVGVCDGFAKNYVTMCNALGVEAFRVVGYSKGAGYTPGVMPKQSDHAWNAIKIGYDYYLLDVTWGIGSCNGDYYEPKLKDAYFCTNPQAFIRTHLPAEQQYQLISPTITLEEFVNMLDLNIDFYENGFTEVTPDYPQFSTTGKITVKVNYEESDDRKTFLYHLYYLQSNTYMEQPNTCWTDRTETEAIITCYANYKGSYKLQVFGGPTSLESFPQLFEYDITCTKNAATPMGFPTTYGVFSNSDMQIIEPLYNPLTRGSLIDVEIKTTTFDNLYIINEDYYRELDYDGNGVFYGESVYIFGEEVYLTTLEGDQFNYIAKYTTIRDAYSATDATFPMSYSAPKNILYSPLTDTLQVGKYYNFKIKCESCTQIAVLEGNKFNDLTQSGATFSGSVKINGIDNYVSIVSISNGYYSTYYRYYISN